MKKISNNFFPIIQRYFTEAFKKKFGSEPAINFGQDGKVVKQMEGLFKPPETAHKLIDDFLNSQKGQEHGYTLSICFSAHTLNLWKAGQLNAVLQTKF